MKTVVNFLRISGEPERVKELKERANLDGLVFNFEAFIPIDDKDPAYQSKEDGVEKFDLKKWQRDHWGVESNAMDGVIRDEAPCSIFYTFQTANKLGDDPKNVADELKKLYPDLDIDWSSNRRCLLGSYLDDNGGFLTPKRSDWDFFNILRMDKENLKKFMKLYCKESETNWFSFSMIIPEPAGYEAYSMTLDEKIIAWRYENWGTPSDADYIYDDPYFSINCLSSPDWSEEEAKENFEEIVGRGFRFYTSALPPFKIYRKMAADGLVFKVEWDYNRAYHRKWKHGAGCVVDGHFYYEKNPVSDYEERLIYRSIYDKDFGPKTLGKQIIVRNGIHLYELISALIEALKLTLTSRAIRTVDESPNFPFSSDKNLSRIEGNLFQWNKTLDLNFLDVSRVTDMSGLFENVEVFACWKETYCCKIKLDISQWDVSNVTKMAHMFDGCKNVDFGDLSKWDRSKVTDC